MSETTPPPANPYQTVQPMSPSDEKLWATLIHIGGILFGFLPALIGYLVLKDRGPFIRAHTATALNFQLTILIAYAVGGITSLILVGLLVLAAAWVATIVFGIIAAIAANAGQPYVYPLSIKFVS
ncbi:hypothetical protein HDC94_002123 [Leifsonia sp. AK011]|uniref:DUF4870 domain-containing protein n=1 Tax=Leifsonia sp. AK011 TaxID=2723075 RepID=UPI00182D143F|nr:DUF4870 domain-containing protein [Leifsonia sp. AK011]NYF10967.1 hypothetical protein [Leifsonia sp. AK011]